MSLARLTSLSTQTLTLLLERQRLQTLPASTSDPHLGQIRKGLSQLREGVLELEDKEGVSEASKLFRTQYERMRAMLAADAVEQDIPRLDPPQTPTPPKSPPPAPSETARAETFQPSYPPYTDDPEDGSEPAVMIQTQQDMMRDQDVHLENLSRSINRQRDISVQINGELEVHTGLLEQLDAEVDDTQGRLSGARRRLDRFSRGAKENGSAVTIGLLILVLLILIIVFKT